MSGPAIAAVIWVLAGSVTAMLPLRLQMVPGVALLISAPVLLVWTGIVHGWLFACIGLLAFASMFRRPLAFLVRRATGRPAPLPPDQERGE